MPHNIPRQALEHIKVLDLTRFRAGPTAARQLADWGADVIKVEMPQKKNNTLENDPIKNRYGPDFQNLHRNKRSLTLNLKTSEGLSIFKELSQTADVIIENYRPNVKYRLGIDYETMSAINPKLVYASISGFGQNGPYENRPGFDQIAQGMGGLMSITGEPGQGPIRAGIPIADLSAGLYSAIGILVALLERQISGKGQWVQSSLLQAQISMLDFQAARFLIDGDIPKQAGNNHPTSIPTGVYPTIDGYINIATSGGEIYERLCRALDISELIDHPDYLTGSLRSKNRDALNEQISAVTRRDTSKAWVSHLNQCGVPCGPIYSIDEIFDDPQVEHLEIATKVEHAKLGPLKLVGQPTSLNRTPFTLNSATPELGEHTDEILSDLKIKSMDIKKLKERGIV